MGAPTPPTISRFKAILDKEDLNYDMDPDGELSVGFDNVMVWISVVDEERTRMTSSWRGRLVEPGDLEKARELVIDCNSNRVGPKSYLVDRGEYTTLNTDCSLYSTEGWSDDQLYNFFDTSMHMMLGFTQEFQEQLPHLVTWEEEED